MTDQLRLYNRALGILGERQLASLTENREPRRVLDEIWDDGLRDYILERALWNFAIRTIKLDYDPAVEPDFGMRRAFTIPDDYVNTAGVASDEYFSNPLTWYENEGEYWYADIDTIYVRYVSKDVAYGYDLGAWPESVAKYASAYLAHEAAPRLTKSGEKEDRAEKRMKRYRKEAKSKDAMEEPARFPPQGAWVRSRSRRSHHNRERGRIGTS